MSRYRAGKKIAVRPFLRNNGLSVVMFGLAAVFIVGLSLGRGQGLQRGAAGARRSRRQRAREEAFQNWQSEFFSIGVF